MAAYCDLHSPYVVHVYPVGAASDQGFGALMYATGIPTYTDQDLPEPLHM